MRRFSQRSHLVTLSEINITPLLDLAFVLLIIFVITTPLLQPNGLKLQLPQGGEADKKVEKKDVHIVEISPRGEYQLDRKPLKLDALERELVAAFKANENMIVYIRADENGFNRDVYAVIDRCQRNGIKRFSLRTETPNSRR